MSRWLIFCASGLSIAHRAGREYVRIIDGPEYTVPEHLERLRAPGLSAKRSLAPRL